MRKLRDLLKLARSRKYNVFYFTLGARTNTPKLLYQQLPKALRDTGLKTLAIHVAPGMLGSQHITRSMNGKTVPRGEHMEEFVSRDRQLRVVYVDGFARKSHLKLLKQIVHDRSKKGLVSVIGDFLLTGPYVPFTERLTRPLKRLLRLPGVFTVVNAESNRGLRKMSRRSSGAANTVPFVDPFKPPKPERYRYHLGCRMRSARKGSPVKRVPYVNLTGSQTRSGYVSLSKNRSVMRLSSA